MLHFNRRVLDDVLNGPSLGAKYYTAVQDAELLGRYDQLAVQLVADNVVVTSGILTGTVTVDLETCTDGENYKQGSIVIPTQSLSTTDATVAWARTFGVNGRYVRLVVTVAGGIGTTVTAHVRLFVTARDQGGVYVRKQVYPLTPHRVAMKFCHDKCKGDQGCTTKCLMCMQAAYKARKGTTWQDMAACRGDCDGFDAKEAHDSAKQ